MNQTCTPQDTVIAFIKARWHANIVDRCQDGFLSEMKRQGVDTEAIEIFEVPGAFDVPFLAKRLASTGRFDAIVASGFVVDGGIYRHDFVAATVIDALMRVQLDMDVPVISAVLTPHNFQEQVPHIEFFTDHFVVKGTEAADATIKILKNLASLALSAEPRDAPRHATCR